ncbi:MAG: acetolactate synthase large subunit, partial [Bacteroidota bacterium]
TGQKPIKSSKQGQFQIIDIVDMMRPITKYTRQIVNGNTIPTIVREAFRLAQEERPGAVHLELPEDIAEEQVSADIIDLSNVRRPMADKKSLETARQMIQRAKSPLLLVGAGANRNRTGQALTDFIENTGIPFVNTQMGKGVIDERNKHYIGTAALSDKDYMHRAIERADLIINVGHDVIEKPPFFMHKGGTQVIHVNYFSAEVDPVYFPQLEVVGDIAESVAYLAEKVDAQKHWDLAPYKAIKEDVESHLTKYFEDKRFPMLPQRIVNLIRRQMPENGILSLDNGIYKIWFARNYEAYQPNTLLLDNALATMGAGLPAAIGAKITYPNKKVVAICGDGGFMMNSQEMETAVRLQLDIVVIILNDNAYGMIKWKQEAMGFDNYGLDFGNPDFVKYADSYGAHGHRIESDEHFQEVFEHALSSKGVHLIDLPVDYSLNQQILIKGLNENQ